MDTPWTYRWGNYVQHLSPREIAKMKKNMKKVPVIQLKSDIYHSHEVNEAENILGSISNHTEAILSKTSHQNTQQHVWFFKKIQLLRQRFISLF